MLLCQRGKRLNARFHLTSPPVSGSATELSLILKDGDYEKVEELLQRRNESLINVDVRDKETGNTPVIWAAKRGHIKVLLLSLIILTILKRKNITGILCFWDLLRV